jgi:hypothetical protein
MHTTAFQCIATAFRCIAIAFQCIAIGSQCTSSMLFNASLCFQCLRHRFLLHPFASQRIKIATAFLCIPMLLIAPHFISIKASHCLPMHVTASHCWFLLRVLGGFSKVLSALVPHARIAADVRPSDLSEEPDVVSSRTTACIFMEVISSVVL